MRLLYSVPHLTPRHPFGFDKFRSTRTHRKLARALGMKKRNNRKGKKRQSISPTERQRRIASLSRIRLRVYLYTYTHMYVYIRV